MTSQKGIQQVQLDVGGYTTVLTPLAATALAKKLRTACRFIETGKAD